MSFFSLSDLDLRPKWCDRPSPARRPPSAAAARPRPCPPFFLTAANGLFSLVGQTFLSARQARMPAPPGSPIGHLGRYEEEPQSFDLFKSGQKVGGGIIGLPRRVKARSRRNAIGRPSPRRDGLSTLSAC